MMNRTVLCPHCSRDFELGPPGDPWKASACPKCGCDLGKATLHLVIPPADAPPAAYATAVEHAHPPVSWVGKAPPDRLLGRDLGGCLIQRIIGHGGIGTVYLALHRALDIPVAIKVLPYCLTGRDRQNIDRLVREARAAAKLQHPNIVSVLNVGIDDGIPFITMQFVEGENLEERVRRRGPMLIDEVCDIMIQICAALEHTHLGGFVHRDVKPSNIIVSRGGVAKLADLGLAKRSADASLTEVGTTVGTPEFMAPEQVIGAAFVDHRADLYSLGCTFYYALCCVPPFTGRSAYFVMKQHELAAVPLPSPLRPDLSESIVMLISKLMAKQPEQRYQTAGEVATLLRMQRSETAAAQPPSMETWDTPYITD